MPLTARKAAMLKPLVLLFLALVTHACSTAPRGELTTADEQRVRGMTEDRSTWVDEPQF